MSAVADWTGGLRADDDLLLAEPPTPPFDWVREGISLWLFDDAGRFALPRIGIEAEPWTWENRRYTANLAFDDGRVLNDAGVGPMPSPLDAQGRPTVIGAGPLRFDCLEPFRRWRVRFDGTVVDTHVDAQLAGTVDRSRRVPLAYDIELDMAAPAHAQNNGPQAFFKLGKGQQRDGLSVGLGWRLEQVLTAHGTLRVDGRSETFTATGMRVKRRSIRTDGLFLRGHCWQCALFPDGRAFGVLAYPPHDDGEAPWNAGYLWQDGRMIPATVVAAPWLRRLTPRGDDATVVLRSELGDTRIEGRTRLSTFRIGNRDIWGLDLQQTGVDYVWDGQHAIGMLERSAPSALTHFGSATGPG